MTEDPYPTAVDPEAVGTYPASAGAGGGYVWDEVLEYRVWCHPERGAPDEHDGSDYFYAFPSYSEASAFYEATRGAEEPLAYGEHIAVTDRQVLVPRGWIDYPLGDGHGKRVRYVGGEESEEVVY